jgi:hypothetical protein
MKKAINIRATRKVKVTAMARKRARNAARTTVTTTVTVIARARARTELTAHVDRKPLEDVAKTQS